MKYPTLWTLHRGYYVNDITRWRQIFPSMRVDEVFSQRPPWSDVCRRLLWQTLARTSFKGGCLTFDGIQLLSKYSGAPFICIAKQSVEYGVSRNRTVHIVRHSLFTWSMQCCFRSTEERLTKARCWFFALTH